MAKTGEQARPCSSESAREFDFWVGEWDVTWGEKATGTNTIRSILDGCAIVEEFDAPTEDFHGTSVSCYNVKRGRWEQMWADNAGNCWQFTGGMDGDDMVLSTREVEDGRDVVLRMVFFEIKPDQFDWRRERSADQGATWQELWRIHYRRRSSQ